MSSGFVLRVIEGPEIGATTAADGPVVVGREGDLIVRDPTVSRKHWCVEPAGDGLRFNDLGSAAGSFVNGVAKTDGQLRAGDIVSFGGSSARVLRLARHADRATGPAVTVAHQGRDRTVAVRDGTTIGRDPGCDVHVDDRSVSRRHAEFRLSEGRVELIDLQTPNGTRVDDRPVRGSVVMADSQRIEVGTATARLTYTEASVDGAPLSVRVVVESSGLRSAVIVDAGAETTIAQVTVEFARTLGVPDSQLLLYRSDDGALFHPDDRWSAIDAGPGDEFVIGVGDSSAFDAATRRERPVPRTTLNQLPRTVWPETPFVVARIDPPESTSWRGRGIVWQIGGGLGAVVIGLTLALVNPDYAVFGLITGGIGIVSIMASIFGEQSRRRHRVTEYRRKLVELDAAISSATARQAASIRSLSPTVDEMEEWLRQASPRLWERRPRDGDALLPTIGVGRRRSRVTTDGRVHTDSPFAGELDAVIERHSVLDDVPVTGPGPAVGSYGIIGDAGRTSSLIARIIIEAAVLLPPTQLRIWVAAVDNDWEWCRWLPHTHGTSGPTSHPDDASGLLADAARSAIEEGGADILHLIVTPTASARLDVEPVRAALRGRVLWIAGGSDQRDLPNGLAVVLDIGPDGLGSSIGAYPDDPIGTVAVDGIDEQRAERLAVLLGRIGATSKRSAPAGLVELLGLGSAASPDIAGSWMTPPTDQLTVAVGSDDTGAPVTVGFRRDGPHGMIAGTTGSGKSELLQSILTALALRHAPDRLTFFLVDFKGGATFAPLAALPHVVGLVTDIEHDGSLASRALTALDAEIDRRKRVLEAAGVPDVIALERAATESSSTVPDLLVVIDEFALLVERQPDVRDRLDTIATQGRSLGIHLLLATQSPSGVISHAIRTNTNLWICLRVVTESESMEILGTRDAARIPDGTPGRAIIRLGAGQVLRTFQAARIARPIPDGDHPVRVTALGRGVGGGHVAPRSSRTELDVVVAHMGHAAENLDIGGATPLWLPPLPTELPAGSFDVPGRPNDRLVTVLGLADRPREHAQVPYSVDLSAAGHVLVSGVFGSGKTTTLTQIGCDLATAYTPADVHLYGIDAGSGSLGPLRELAHVADVIGVNDTERLARLIDRLTSAVERRREELATAGSGDFLRWRAAGGDQPWIVVLVDDYPSFREVAEREDNGRLLERFNSLLQNGPAVGMHVVVAVSQAVDLRTREINLVSGRIVLRSADPADFALVDARFAPADVPRLPPGRGLVEHATEVQVCVPDPSAVSGATVRGSGTVGWPSPVRRLPRTVDRTELAGTGGGLILGVGGPEVEPVEVPVAGPSSVVLVAGPPQSGRSSTLLGLMESLGSPHVVVLAPRQSPLRELEERSGLTVHTGVDDLGSVLDAFIEHATQRSLLVIDDAEVISSAPGVSQRLEQVLRGASETGISVFVSARVNDLPGMFDPWARYVMSLRRVVLLQPTADDAFLFSSKLPRIPPPMVPGRGLLIVREHVTVVQVAPGTTVGRRAT